MEPPLKSPKYGDWRESGLVSMWRRWENSEPRWDMEAPCPFPHTLPYTSLPSECLSVSLISFYNKLFAWVLWVALASCSSKLWRGWDGVRGTSDIEPTYQSTGDHLDLGFEVRDEGQSFGTWALHLWYLTRSPGRESELSWIMTPKQYHRMAWCGEPPTYPVRGVSAWW